MGSRLSSLAQDIEGLADGTQPALPPPIRLAPLSTLPLPPGFPPPRVLSFPLPEGLYFTASGLQRQEAFWV